MENEGSRPTVPDGSDEEPIAASTTLAGAATGVPLWRVGLLVTTVALAVVFVAITGLGFVSGAGGGLTQPAAPTATAAFPPAQGLPTATASSTDGPTATPGATATDTGSGPGGGAPTATPTPRPTPKPTATPTPTPTPIPPTPTPGPGGG